MMNFGKDYHACVRAKSGESVGLTFSCCCYSLFRDLLAQLVCCLLAISFK